MNANEKLVDFILNLTEEQIEKLYENLPLLKSAIEDEKIVSGQLSTVPAHYSHKECRTSNSLSSL